ncbi:hypothetical protein PCE1_000418 [Barthelona sp. PCE]
MPRSPSIRKIDADEVNVGMGMVDEVVAVEGELLVDKFDDNEELGNIRLALPEDFERLQIKNDDSLRMEDIEDAEEFLGTSISTGFMNEKKKQKKRRKRKQKHLEQKENEEPEYNTFVPGRDEITDDMELDYDPAMYDSFFDIKTPWPSLTLDVIPDSFGAERTELPVSMLLASGSQSQCMDDNFLYVLRCDNVNKTRIGWEENDVEDEEDISLTLATFNHKGFVNRVRVNPVMNCIIATQAEYSSKKGSVSIFNVDKQLELLYAEKKPKDADDCLIHTEKARPGYGLCWSPFGDYLLSGHVDGSVFKHELINDSFECTAEFKSHTDSVEDITHHPSSSFFATVGVDRSIHIWNAESEEPIAVREEAHDTDINVADWNAIQPNIIATGADDGTIKVWNLEDMAEPMHEVNWHNSPITSVQWAPFNETMLIASSEDHSISIWDFSMDETEEDGVPNRLMFIHAGQKEIKEVRWHPQCPGFFISTSGTGYHIAKPMTLMLSSEEIEEMQEGMESIEEQDE